MEMELVKQVKRKRKPFTGALRAAMLILGIFFILLAIIFSTGLMLPGALMILLYYIYGVLSKKGYEYRLSQNQLAVFVIYGERFRRQVQQLDLHELEVVAPHWHEAVAAYRKHSGSVRLKKYDYTSYEDDIPYYTMIIGEGENKIKLLLDLDEEMLRAIRQKYPQKVIV